MKLKCAIIAPPAAILSRCWAAWRGGPGRSRPSANVWRRISMVKLPHGGTNADIHLLPKLDGPGRQECERGQQAISRLQKHGRKVGWKVTQRLCDDGPLQLASRGVSSYRCSAARRRGSWVAARGARADSLLDQMWRLSDIHKVKPGGGEDYADRS